MPSRTRRCVGILREVKNKWERRVPLTPQHVGELVQAGIKVLIQPSERRIFSDFEYASCGAIVTEDLEPASTIFGVKEFPATSLIADRNYVVFSHVIKAQEENMPFLDECLRRRIRLFDYECIRGADNKRLVAFGRYAGIAGMIDGLRGVGERFLSLGFSTPFMGVSSSYMYPSLEAALAAVESAGREISRIGLPRAWTPFTFAFTGSGNVAQGAQEVFEVMPHEMVSVSDLQRLKQGLEDGDRHKVYGCKVATSDLVAPRHPDTVFSREEYYENPEAFTPVFHETVAPFTNVLVNGIYWDRRFPRLLTRQQMRQLHADAVEQGFKQSALMAIADISCDISGSIDFLEQASTIDKPFYRYDPVHDCVYPDSDGRGVLMVAVDNLPAEFPREASSHFSTALLEFVEALSESPATDPFPDTFPEALSGACICSMGELTLPFSYIRDLRKVNTATVSTAAASAIVELSGHMFDSGLINQALDLIEYHQGGFRLLLVDAAPNTSTVRSKSHLVLEISASTEDAVDAIVDAIAYLTKAVPKAEATLKRIAAENYTKPPVKAPVSVSSLPDHAGKVLVLGSGFVASPLVEYLAEAQRYRIVLASNEAEKAQAIAQGHANVEAVSLNTDDVASLQRHIGAADVVVSLLPTFLHKKVALECISQGVDMVTASYVSEMAALDEAARDAGVLLMNEAGLDPGLDHMSAMKVIDEVHGSGGRIASFASYCGGLPAPEAAGNPFRYKFSWSPIGVLNAAQNTAVYLEDGHVVRVSGDELLQAARPLHMNDVLNLEHVPNRDCRPYAAAYGIEDADSIYRGTIRYTGFSALMSSMKRLGLLDKDATLDRNDAASEWAEVLRRMFMSAPSSGVAEQVQQRLQQAKVPPEEISRCISALDWLEMTGSSGLGGPAVPCGRLVDAFCDRLQRKLTYEPHERDLVLMHHEFGVEWPDGRRQRRTSSLYCYGEPGKHSAMALTVGLTAAITTRLILDGRISSVGVHTPMSRQVYAPVLKEMAVRGITFVEREYSVWK